MYTEMNFKAPSGRHILSGRFYVTRAATHATFAYVYSVIDVTSHVSPSDFSFEGLMYAYLSQVSGDTSKLQKKKHIPL